MFLSKVSLKNFSAALPFVIVEAVSSRMATTALTFKENGHISFGLVGSSAISGQSFVVVRLLNQKQLDTKGFMATMTFVWDLRYLSIRPVGDRFLLAFSREADYGFMDALCSLSLLTMAKKIQPRYPEMNKGLLYMFNESWLQVIVRKRDQSQTLSISCDFPTWVEILGLPPRLMTEEAVEKIGSNLGDVIHPDKNNIRLGLKARVCLFHHLDSPMKQAYPPLDFEFGVGSEMVVATVTFKSQGFGGGESNATGRDGESFTPPASLMAQQMSEADMQIFSVLPQVTGVKRNVHSMEQSMELSLPHHAGTLLVSPRKKCKVGRPVGLKLAASSMKKTKTRHFSTRCSLEMGDVHLVPSRVLRILPAGLLLRTLGSS
ncbi:hypothetical protein ACLB2K_013238 [Fragaria x ananassa]